MPLTVTPSAATLTRQSYARHRRIPLELTADVAAAGHAVARLLAMPGIRSAVLRAEPREVLVHYDLAQVRLEQIERRLGTWGVRLAQAPQQRVVRCAVYERERADQRRIRGV